MSCRPRGVAEKARRAAQLYLAGGVTQGALAERFGISKASISAVLRRMGASGAVRAMGGDPATLLMGRGTLDDLTNEERERIRRDVTNAGETGNIGRHDHSE